MSINRTHQLRPVCWLAGVILLLGGWSWCGAEDAGVNPRGPGPATWAKPNKDADKAEAELGIGKWIWTTNFSDKQFCRLWRSFTIPGTNMVRKAILRLTADNAYRVYLDGREIGQGGNWNSLTDYDVTWLLAAGAHVLAVEAFNDAWEGGLILGLNVDFTAGPPWRLVSDKSWYIVPENVRRWPRRTAADSSWIHAQEVAVLGQFPWWREPKGGIYARPPLLPELSYFWQTGWFLAVVLVVAGLALILSVRLAAKLAVQTRAQKLLERERALIARDIHDDLGAGLTQLVLQGEVAHLQTIKESFAPQRAARLAPATVRVAVEPATEWEDRSEIQIELL